MRQFDRYFGIEFIKVFLFSLAGFTFMIWIINILEVSKIDTTQEKFHIYLYLLYTLPRIFSEVLPAALLFTTCYIVSQFSMSGELSAIQSAGVSFYRAIIPVYLTGIMATLFLFFFQNFLVTPANRAAQEEMLILKKDIGPVKNIIWQRNLRGKDGFYFIYYFDKEKLRVIGGFNYLELDENGNPIVMYQAKKAQYNKTSKDWTLEDLKILKFDKQLRNIILEKKKTLTRSFPEDITFFSNPFKDPKDLNIFELLTEIERRKSMGFSFSQYYVQFHASIAFPLMCLIVSIVGSIFGSMRDVRATNPLVKSILISAVFMFVFVLLFNSGKNLGENDIVPAFVAGWGPTIFFLLISFFLLFKNRH